jgi:hypothetical protein
VHTALVMAREVAAFVDRAAVFDVVSASGAEPCPSALARAQGPDLGLGAARHLENSGQKVGR